MKKIVIKTIAFAVAFSGLSVNAAFVTVESIQKLKEYSNTADDVVVLDYYAHSGTVDKAGRGHGGGLFRWAPSSRCPIASDEGRFVTSTNTSFSGMWERMFNGETPNVRMWGAKGDCYIDGSGVVQGTSDTLAFQRMFNGVTFDGVNYVRNYNEVLISKGNYRVTQAIVIPSAIRIRGEAGWDASQIVMNETSTDNIFVTQDAARMLVGGLTFPGNGDFVNSLGQTAFMAHGLCIENLSFYFGNPYRSGQTNASILVASPGDTASFKDIVTTGGGYGIRALWGGQPGLKVFNSSFFCQCVAGVAVEGVQLADGNYVGSGGPITLANISGDSMSEYQVGTASLILFTNYAPVATINDISGEGLFGRGLIRCIMPPNGGHVNLSTINVHGGQCQGGIGGWEDFYVVENPHSTTYYTPVFSMEAVNCYLVTNLVKDLWVGRNVIASSADSQQQVPIRRPLQYFSTAHDMTRFNSVLTVGDTVYQDFTPTTTGWYRIALMPSWTTHLGARIAINSWDDSSVFEVNLEATATPEINLARKSKSVGTAPYVSKVRAVSFYDSTLGYRRGAVEVFVQSTPPTSGYGWTSDNRKITISMPLEGNEKWEQKTTALIKPTWIGGVVTDTSNLQTGESSPISSGVVSLLR